MSNKENEPVDDFISPLQAEANNLHELYQGYVKAGFSVEQAFALTQQVLDDGLEKNRER